MKRYRLDPEKPRQLTPAETRRLDAMPIDYSDIPPLGNEFFAKAAEAWPPAKQQLTIRLDTDVLTWLKANGRGYQTRINRILQIVGPWTFHGSTENQCPAASSIEARVTASVPAVAQCSRSRAFRC